MTILANPVRPDPRRDAYCAKTGRDVFGGIVYGSQIAIPDRFDVELIHSEAREAFAKLLDRASSPEPPEHGKILLFVGEAGSGKTHLMRAFRAATHNSGSGYCGYLQLATATDHYGRYILSKLLDSLEQPYRSGHAETGLKRLARGVLEAIEAVTDEERQQLCEDLLEPEAVARLVHRLAYFAVQIPRFHGIDINVIRALLFTLANDARIHAVVLQWLRCEDLSRYDRELLGDLVPQPQSDKPAKMIRSMGKLMHAVETGACVLLVDQMEELVDGDAKHSEPGADLRAAVNTLVEIADSVPNSVIVIGCLLEQYEVARPQLPKAKLDRLTRDPETIILENDRKSEEIAALLALRLDALFEAAGIPPDPADPIAPFASADLAGLAGFRSRDILDLLRRHRESCMLAGEWVDPDWRAGGARLPLSPTSSWPQRWNDFLAAFPSPVPDDEPVLAELLASAIRSVSDEVPDGHAFAAIRDDRFVAVDAQAIGTAGESLFVAVCNKSPRGGGLGNQVKEVAARAAGAAPILVRSTEFPKVPSQVVTKEIAKLVAPVGKGRRVVVADSDWRALAAFRAFRGQHAKEAGFADWQRSDKPLCGLTAIRAILALDTQKFEAPIAVAPISPPPVTELKPVPVQQLPVKPSVIPALPGVITLGRTRSTTPSPVTMASSEFCRHAAFLGGSGSGKTTAALTVIEQLLMSGIPAVLLDRKGDLGRYADPDAWAEIDPDADRAERRRRFRESVDAVIYTPGSEKGRPLRIPVVPELVGLTTAEAEQIAQIAASGLMQMMGYNQKAPDPKSVILQKAIEVLARSTAAPIAPVTVKALHRLVSEMDESLTNETDGYEEKHFKKLGQDLLTLGHLHRRLLEGGEPLDVDVLLGRGAGAASGRTRLSIINTQFLGDDSIVDFWVAQLLLCIDRWRAKSPSNALRAVFFFDEADKYLPAVGKPATKAPMEGLLKRARSAGLGIFLATQSPGDLDYKCRDQVLTWLIGRVKEPVAIAKLKPMLDRRPEAADKLAVQAAGEFYLVRESGVSPIHASLNLMPTDQLPEDRTLQIARLNVKP